MVLLSYSCDTLVVGLTLQSALADWWCLHWIPETVDPSIYTRPLYIHTYTPLRSGRKGLLVPSRPGLISYHIQVLYHFIPFTPVTTTHAAQHLWATNPPSPLISINFPGFPIPHSTTCQSQSASSLPYHPWVTPMSRFAHTCAHLIWAAWPIHPPICLGLVPIQIPMNFVNSL